MTIKTAEYTVSSARVEQCPAGELPEFAFIGRSNVGKSSLINMLTGQSHLAKTSATPGKTVLINHFLIKGQGAGSKGQGAGSKGQGARGKEQENTESPSKSLAPCPMPLAPKDASSLARKESWYLVDLPGYGYARRGMEQREQLRQMITGYILRREQMMNLFLLIDVRHAPQSIDLEFIDWLGENGIPFSIVFTKADKLSKGKLAAAVSSYLARLADSWEELPPHFVTSSETKQGREELLAYIDDILNM